jgi:hypothetical protein
MSKEAAMRREKKLTASEWQVLKSVGQAGTAYVSLDSWVLAHLMAADLVTDEQGRPALTEQGRALIVRGSVQNWDLAA